jgi:beta-N-acetylhexosaminidase
MPALATLADLPAHERGDAAYSQGKKQGQALAELGVTMNFAPVADLRPGVDGGIWDQHTHLELRAISSDANVVADIILAYTRGLKDAGITATVKHFPGLGRVTSDTHHFRTRLTTAKAELEKSDWLPFRRALSSKNAVIMLSHTVLPAIDAQYPASHSKRLVDDLLRHEWDYQGVIVTDDLVMSPIYQYGYCNAIIRGLNAGVDLLLIAYDGQQFYRAMYCAMNANRDGLLDKARLNISKQRLNALMAKQKAP